MNNKKQKKLNTRNMILNTAEELFKKYGIESSGIKKIMNEIGLTVGGFYSHFKSKDDLIKNSLNLSLNSTMQELLAYSSAKEGKERLTNIIDIYLGEEHSKNIEKGCPISAMASDISRCNDEIKQEVEVYFDTFFNAVEGDLKQLEGKDITRDDFYTYLSMCVGSVIMSRIVTDPELASTILRGTREKIKKDIELI